MEIRCIAWGEGYDHFWVCRQKKEFWKEHKETKLQVGAQVIDSWRHQLKSQMPRQTKSTAWAEDHVWCASYLHSTAGGDEADKIRTAVRIIRSYFGEGGTSGGE